MATKISSGGFGTIFKVKMNDKTYTALKIVQHKGGSIQNILEIVLYYSNSQFIVRAFDHTLDRLCYKILMPLALYDLSKIMKIKIPKDLNILKLIYETCQGLEYMHSRFIVHGDIKPSNILIFKESKKYVAKITDFSLSGICEDRIYNRNAYTLGFKAPEVEIKGSYNFKADIWALGKTFKILQEKFNELKTPEFNYLIIKMCEYDEDKRYTINDVINDKCFLKCVTRSKVYSSISTLSELNKVLSANPSDFIDRLILKMSRRNIYEDDHFIDEEINYLDTLLTVFRRNIF